MTLRNEAMTKFIVMYYDVFVEFVYAPTRSDAVKQVGVRHGGKVGIYIV